MDLKKLSLEALLLLFQECEEGYEQVIADEVKERTGVSLNVGGGVGEPFFLILICSIIFGAILTGIFINLL